MLFDTLGGSLRLAEVFAEVDFPEIAEKIAGFFLEKIPDGKIHFGVFADGTLRKKVLSDTKKILQKNGRNGRFLNRNFTNLDAGTLHRERVFSKENAAEILIIPSSGKFLLAKTVSAQRVEDFAERDFGKPARDMVVGMLPPKLALMMVNFSANEKGSLPPRIWDPFCGTGTILVEAARMGISVFGSDVSDKMVTASQQNMTHFFPKLPLDDSIFLHDAMHNIPKKVFETVVVSEGFLGPIFKKSLSPQDFARAKKMVEGIYEQFFLAAAHSKIQKMVISMPFWKLLDGRDGFCEKTLASAQKFWENNAALRFRRKDQIVGREIFVFRRKSNIPR